MQPIETNCKGFRFWSRSEAKWAVFLDTIQINWRYEEQGFDLDGTRHLPDFWGTGLGWMDRDKRAEAYAEEVDNCRLLSEASGKLVLLISSVPWIEGERTLYDVMLFSEPADHRHMSDGWEFGEGRHNSREIWLVSDDLGAFTLNPIPREGDHKYPLSGSYAYQIIEGLKAARGARFEHGESGAP